MTFKVLRFLALPALLAASAGCNTNICDRINTSHNKLVSKAQPCGVDEGTFDHAVCLTKYKSCTAADTDTVNKIWDCLDKLGTCNPADSTTWLSSVQDCQVVNKVSTQDCADAVNVQGTP